MSGGDRSMSSVFNFTYSPSALPFTASKKTYLTNDPDARYEAIGTGALVFDTTGSPPRLLLLQRASTDSMPNKWEIPGGACDDDDPSILHGVARELWEEAGLKASRISSPVGDPHFFTSRSGKRICKFHFVVETETDADGRQEPILSPEEHQQFLWASEDEVKSGTVGDVVLDFTTKDTEDLVLLAFAQLREGRVL